MELIDPEIWIFILKLIKKKYFFFILFDFIQQNSITFQILFKRFNYFVWVEAENVRISREWKFIGIWTRHEQIFGQAVNFHVGRVIQKRFAFVDPDALNFRPWSLRGILN